MHRLPWLQTAYPTAGAAQFAGKGTPQQVPKKLATVPHEFWLGTSRLHARVPSHLAAPPAVHRTADAGGHAPADFMFVAKSRAAVDSFQ